MAYDVITIGTATRDVFVTSGDFKVLKDPEHLVKLGFETGEVECFAFGSKIEVQEPTFAVGGGAANAAVTFSRQGLKTAALFRVGLDVSGDAVVDELKGEKVTCLAVRSKDRGTAYATVLLNASGERTVLVYRGASGKLQRKEVPLRKLRADWFYIVPGSISLSLLDSVVTFLKRRGGCVAMNPSDSLLKLGWQKLKPLLKSLDVVIVNREEAASLTKMDYKDERGIFGKFDDLIPGIAVMTEGPSGAMVSDGRYVYRSGIFEEKKLVDRTGAGDAFGSAFVAGLIRKNDVNYALRLASANATSVVEKVGAHTGCLSKRDFEKSRWRYLDLDVEPL